jgi:hypothetical protein
MKLIIHVLAPRIVSLRFIVIVALDCADKVSSCHAAACTEHTLHTLLYAAQHTRMWASIFCKSLCQEELPRFQAYE